MWETGAAAAALAAAAAGQAYKYFKRFALANGSRKCSGTAAAAG